MVTRACLRHSLEPPEGAHRIDSTAGKIRVYLIDDHPIVREGFARALGEAPDIAVVGQAGTASEALKEAQFEEPDVILVDLNMPDRDGIELVGALRARMTSSAARAPSSSAASRCGRGSSRPDRPPARSDQTRTRPAARPTATTS
jgi:CheY-like chemotaxis protein